MLTNFGRVAPRLWRAAQPDAAGLSDLVVLGVETILKLNGDEEMTLARERELFHGVGGVTGFTLDFPIVDLAQVRTVVRAIDDRLTDTEHVLVHCTLGRDRTGLVIGAWQLAHGLPLDDVLIERRRYGTDWLTDHTVDLAVIDALYRLRDEREAARA